MYVRKKCISVQPLAIFQYKHITVLPDFRININHDKANLADFPD